MSRFWTETARQLEPYVPGEQPQDQQYIKLNTNENPYPPSPKVIEAIKATADDRLRLYPDPDGTPLKNALAAYHGLSSEEVFLGNGSDEVLAFAFLAFFKQHKPVLYPDITYSFYDVYCQLYGIDACHVPLNARFEIEVSDYERNNGGIIFPNPNAPTGVALQRKDIEQILAANPNSVVIVDEAYVDFGAESAVPLIAHFPNLLVIQTFSKSRSLAGLRIGYALGSAELIEGLERIKNSFNSYPLDRIAIAAGVAAIEDQSYFSTTIRQITASRENVAQRLKGLGFEVLPSSANFLFVKNPSQAAEALYQQLKLNGVLVRYFSKPRIGDYLRITVGTEEEMRSFCDTVSTLIKV